MASFYENAHITGEENSYAAFERGCVRQNTKHSEYGDATFSSFTSDCLRSVPVTGRRHGVRVRRSWWLWRPWWLRRRWWRGGFHGGLGGAGGFGHGFGGGFRSVGGGGFSGALRSTGGAPLAGNFRSRGTANFGHGLVGTYRNPAAPTGFAGGFDHHGFHHHGFHGRRFFGYGGDWFYPDYAYDYGYGYGDCWWLRHEAIITGSPYWWSRYEACLANYY